MTDKTSFGMTFLCGTSVFISKLYSYIFSTSDNEQVNWSLCADVGRVNIPCYGLITSMTVAKSHSYFSIRCIGRYGSKYFKTYREVGIYQNGLNINSPIYQEGISSKQTQKDLEVNNLTHFSNLLLLEQTWRRLVEQTPTNPVGRGALGTSFVIPGGTEAAWPPPFPVLYNAYTAYFVKCLALPLVHLHVNRTFCGQALYYARHRPRAFTWSFPSSDDEYINVYAVYCTRVM